MDAETPPEAPAVERKSLFSEPDFLRLWLIGLVLFAVRWLEMLAVGVYTYQATGSAFIVAMMTMLRLLPMSLFGAFLGAAAERLERRTALIIMVAGVLTGVLAIGLLATFELLQVWHLAVASLVNGLAWAADNPVRRMMIGDVSGPERMGQAMSLDVGANNASRMLGPTLGGVLLASLGIGGVFFLAGGMYLVALAAALRVEMRSRRPASADAPPPDTVPFFAGLREGLSWIARDRRLIGVFLVTVVFNIFGWPLISMIPVIGQDNLDLGPQGIGLLASIEGFGAFVGAIAIAAFGRRAWYGRIYALGVCSFALMLALFALSPTPVLAGLALLLTGIGGAGFNVMQATLIYLHSPPSMRARMLGVLSVCIGTAPLGFLYLGFLAEVLGAQAAVAAIGFQGVLAIILIRPLWRAIK